MEAEKRTQSRTEREAGLPQGYIIRLLGTSTKAKQIFAPGPDVIRKLADYLKVSYEWLAIGRGSMRGEGYAASALESAMRFAAAHGTRQDAIDAAVVRHRDVANMTGIDWILSFDHEARRLDREGVPRPEEVAAEQKKIRRLAKRDVAAIATKKAADAEIVVLEAKKAARERGELPPAPKKKSRRR